MVIAGPCDAIRCTETATEALYGEHGVEIARLCREHAVKALANAITAYGTRQAALPYYERDGFR